jgi:hypothetical protein
MAARRVPANEDRGHFSGQSQWIGLIAKLLAVSEALTCDDRRRRLLSYNSTGPGPGANGRAGLLSPAPVCCKPLCRNCRQRRHARNATPWPAELRSPSTSAAPTTNVSPAAHHKQRFARRLCLRHPTCCCERRRCFMHASTWFSPASSPRTPLWPKEVTADHSSPFESTACVNPPWPKGFPYTKRFIPIPRPGCRGTDQTTLLHRPEPLSFSLPFIASQSFRRSWAGSYPFPSSTSILF